MVFCEAASTSNPLKAFFISMFMFLICSILALSVCFYQSVCLYLYPRMVSMVTGTELDQMGIFSMGCDFCGKRSNLLILQMGTVLKR